MKLIDFNFLFEASRNFNIGSKQGAYLFATLKAPLLITCTLTKTILNSKVIYSSAGITAWPSRFLNNVVVTPIAEEILFRGVLQEAIKSIAKFAIKALRIHESANQKLHQKKVDETAFKTARIVTSILFGLAHYPCGGIVQAISSGTSAYYGESELKERVGLSASIGCHTTNNLICEILVRTASLS